MSTNTDVPEIYQQLQGGQKEMLAHQQLHTLLLHKAVDQLKAIDQKKTPFRLQVPAIANQSGTLQVPFTSCNRGEILTVQNPTAAPLAVELRETNGALVIKVTVPAGDYKALFVPFFDRLVALAGPGMIISGNAYE